MSNVYLLTVDSLRYDRFSPEFFPECWSMFDSSFAIFDNAYANGVATPFSFPALLTGIQTARGGDLPKDWPTIAELYEGPTWALTNNPHLRVSRGYDRGFDSYVNNVNNISSGGSRDTVFRKVKSLGGKSKSIRRIYNYIIDNLGLDFVPQTGHAGDVRAALERAISSNDGLFWAHFMDPHYPFLPDKIPDRGLEIDLNQDRIQEINNRFQNQIADETDCVVLEQIYDEVVRYLDRELFTFFEYLKEKGHWEESIIILTADHGEAFFDKGYFNHQWDADPIDELVHIPLLVKFPGGLQGGQRHNHLVNSADIVPTLADELGWDIDYPEYCQPLTETSERIAISRSNSAIRVITNKGSVIRRRDGSISQSGSTNDSILDLIKQLPIPRIRQSPGATPGAQTVNQELEARLEYLGYK